MPRTSFLAAIGLLFLIGCVQSQAQVVLSDFNLNSDGWVAYANADPTTTVVYSVAGGASGGGAIILQEPANGADDYFVAPSKFTGDMSAYYGGILSFDLKLNPAWDSSSEAAMVILTGTYNSNPLSIGYLPPSNQYPNAGGFTSFVLNLDTSTAWNFINGADHTTGTLASSAQIQSILGSLTTLRILGDWTNSQDLDLLDNVIMTAVPEPSAYAALCGAGALCLATLGRRWSARAAAAR